LATNFLFLAIDFAIESSQAKLSKLVFALGWEFLVWLPE